MLRKEEVFNQVRLDTEKKLQKQDFTNIGIDAFSLSLDLGYQRSNLSKDLNELWREGDLIKVSGRPTRFICRKTIEKQFPDIYYPSLISNTTDLNRLIHDKKDSQKSIPQDNTPPFVSYMEEIKNVLLSFTNGSAVSLHSSLGIYRSIFFDELINRINHGNNSFELLYIKYYSFEDFKSFANLFESAIKNENKIIILENVEKYSDSIILYLYDYLSFHSPITHPKQNNKIILYYNSNENVENKNINKFDLLTYTVKINSFYHQSIFEKSRYLNIIFKYYSKNINKNISIHRDIFNSLVSTNVKLDFVEIDSLLYKALIYTNQINDLPNLLLNFSDLEDFLNNQLDNISLENEMKKVVNFSESYAFYTIKGESTLDPFLNTDNYTVEESIYDELSFASFSISSINDDIPNIINYFISNEDFNKKTYNDSITQNMSEISYFFKSIEAVNSLKNITSASFVFYSYCLHLNDYYKDESIETINYEVPDNYERLWETNILIPEAKTKYSINLLENVVVEINNFFIKKEVFLLLVVENDEDEKLYNTIINSYNFEEYYVYNSNKIKSLELINNVIKVINQYTDFYNFLIITDQYNIFKSSTNLKRKTLKNIEILYPLSIPLIDKSLSVLKKGSILDDFKKINQERIEDGSNTIETQNKNEFLQKLDEKILKKDLIFLDSDKSNPLLMGVLEKICYQLNLVPDNSLITKFITHSSFMIERLIKNESMKFDNLNTYYSENIDTMNYIKQEFLIIERTFGINISPSELAFINEIFK
ncbi:PRD domain-containing protein [Globicatella sulfidifaciens]|uniref:PRD domain-containing protein n=1 Tax=Globicatella sulfidifaciens TaxID=136093 RepID=A0A7X8GZL4_9LACT|nr:PRD domain-containing protein [Globicatella sulfidifaciens]NLJ17576.1 PRD domain-containing protein [Globicatella sulfidifaciens]